MDLAVTPLDALHRELGARMVPFAGYAMPLQYPEGIIREHLRTREQAGLFDVSHMGQLVLEGPGSARLLESVVPADILELPVGAQCYTLLTNPRGGVRDDLIITRWAAERFFLVVNAACRAADVAYLRARLAGQALTELGDRALLALQGPRAREVLAGLCPAAAQLSFMHGCEAQLEGALAWITCSGYTGEDGFEISLPAHRAEAFARRLLGHAPVHMAGLGARDSLRLEAGLCLYGHDLTPETDPVTAGLYWAVGRARRPGGARPGGFPGADAIFARRAAGPERRRVGLRVEGRRPVREGQAVLAGAGEAVGEISSACYGPSVEGPIAMAYVRQDCAGPGTRLEVDVRGRRVPVTVTTLPFVPPRYRRG
jgi:aminomethyltransferase